MNFYVATFTAFGLQNVHEFGMFAQAESFADGFSECSSLFGGDGLVFVLPRDVADLLEAFEGDENLPSILATLRERGVPLPGGDT